MFEWKTDSITEDQLLNVTLSHAARIWELQNEDHEPEVGTLGFIVGTAYALGNIMAVYMQNQPRHVRKRFEANILDTVEEAFRNPMITGTPSDVH